MPIAVYTKLEGAGRKPYDGPQDCRPPEYWDGATCVDCKFFDAATSTCGGQPVDAQDLATWCFLWEPRRADR